MTTRLREGSSELNQQLVKGWYSSKTSNAMNILSRDLRQMRVVLDTYC